MHDKYSTLKLATAPHSLSAKEIAAEIAHLQANRDRIVAILAHAASPLLEDELLPSTSRTRHPEPPLDNIRRRQILQRLRIIDQKLAMLRAQLLVRTTVRSNRRIA